MPSEASIDEYFRAIHAGGLASLWRLEVHLLGRAEVEELTRRFRGHPIIDHFDGAVLDDPNTSNHHILLRRPPVNGQILFLAHDDNSRIVFSSLAEFLACAERAKIENLSLPELHSPISPVAPDQAELSNAIRTLVAEDQVDVVLALVPSMDLSDKALLAELLVHDDFFLGEAVAEAIRTRPSVALAALARQCAEHPHPQVARAGQRALEACAK